MDFSGEQAPQLSTNWPDSEQLMAHEGAVSTFEASVKL
jgi:hypothetical protein